MRTKLISTQNNLAEPTRRKMIELLNQQLADVLDLGLQAKQAHWNVKGPQKETRRRWEVAIKDKNFDCILAARAHHDQGLGFL